MDQGFIMFSIHFSCYWGLVFKYDNESSYTSYLDATINSLKNQLLYTLPGSLLFFTCYPVKYDHLMLSFLAILPLILLSDVYFFLTHRMLHTRLLWKYHKAHHTNQVHVAKALDANLAEHVIGNLGSFAVPFFILRHFGVTVHIYVLYLWVAISTINTCISHSSKRILGDKGVHEMHHRSLKYNFGTGFYILDRLFGTYKE